MECTKRHVLPRALLVAVAGGWCCAGATLLPTLVQGQEKVELAQAEQGEVLTRGPVHEAFAAPFDLNPTKGVIVAKEAPEPIEELAPNQKPGGDNVVWISGYWAFDDERDDFFWVSGVWRAIPNGVQWIPGYWVSVDGGHQWVSGMWVKTDADLVYLPEPPATQESGPSSAAPTPDHFWIPGSWTWRDGRYVWKTGYWQQAHQGWVWTPSRYVWTPQGYLYTTGYWDYDVSQRGMLFAPVYFNRRIYSRSGFTYSPNIVLNTALLATNLFVRPTYRHYYFGDYYGNNYARSGYTPWVRYSNVRTGYDPLYAYARWQHRNDQDWSQTLERNFDNRVQNADSRPARTFAEFTKRGVTADSPVLAVSLKDFSRIGGTKESRIELQEVSKEYREETRKMSADLAKLRKERQQFDARAVSTKKGEKSEPVKFEISKSPVVSSSKSKDRQPPRSDDEPEKTAQKEIPKVDPTKRDPANKADPLKRDPPTIDPPKKDPPKKDPPKKDPPKKDPPKKDPPKKDPPKKDPPNLDPPKKDPPKVDPPKQVDPPKKNPPKFDSPKRIEPPKVDPPNVPKKDDEKKGASIRLQERFIV